MAEDVDADDDVTRAAQANWLFERLPPWVVDTLSLEHKEAIHEAVSDPE
jgi:hypothetical protein